MTDRIPERFIAKKQIFKLLGESFFIETPAGELLCYSHQKAFRLKEDIRVYADREKTRELISIRARQMIDFAAAYDVVDSRTGEKLGVLRRKGFASIVRDTWEILDPSERPLASLMEDSTGMALVRRLALNLIPQTFHLDAPDGRRLGTIVQKFNPLRLTYEVDLSGDQPPTLSRPLAIAAVVLLLAVEGRQE